MTAYYIALHMDKHTVSFRIDTDKVNALDSLAQALGRDRSHLLNEAVAAYLEAQRWQVEQIQKSLRQADEGKLLAHAKVKQIARKWRRG
jgi:RHH-type transcriptional regulator, rel operon repressor / antitoxin RelB